MNTTQLDNSWRTATIFISSTFVDMNEERDVLNSYVLPKLNEYFNPKRVIIQLVDLRWGVRTAEIEDESARNNKVLSVCFDEIDRSQPFFVAILGDRYGYNSLDQNIIDSISYKLNGTILSDSSDLYKKSVTELEIIYGALLHPDKQLSNSVFCMRQADYTGMSESYAKQYISNKDKIEILRGKIIDSCKRNNSSKSIINYHVAGWNNETGRFESFDKAEFGELVCKKLEGLISKHFDTFAETKMSFPQQLQYEQETFLSSTDNVETDKMSDRLSALLRNSHQLNIIQGESGIGKTTLLKHLARHLFSECNKHKHVFYFNAGLSARCRDVKNMLICWIWQVEKIVGDSITDIEKSNEEDLRTVLECQLQKCVEQSHEFSFIIDSYDLLYKNPVSESLSFLRFATKSYVATQLETKIHFHQDLDSQTQIMRGLSLDEAKQMMKNLFKSLHKDEYPQLCNSLKCKFEDSVNPLWIELAVNILSKLSAKDFTNIRKSQSSTSDGSEAIERYLISMIDDFPSQVGQLFGYLYNKAFADEDWSFLEQYIIWLIAISRNGIRESDLVALTREQGWNTLLFARIRYYFYSCIKEKSVDKCWGFNHEIYNQVLKIHLAKSGERMNVNLPEMLHGALGHHYVHCDRQYDLRTSECVYHLIRGNDKESTAIFLLSSDAPNGIENECSNAVREIADFIIENHEAEKNYYKVPKGMPIPEIGYMNNRAIIWLMEMFEIKPIVENDCQGRLLLIIATAVTEELNNRGASSASLFLNMQLQSLLTNKKIAIQDDFKMWLAILTGNNIEKAQHESGGSYDVAFRKTDGVNDDIDDSEDWASVNEYRALHGEHDYYAELRGKIYAARKELFMGNHHNAIAICKELQNNDKFYSGKISEDIYNEVKKNYLLCMADSYHALGLNQKAVEIYRLIETSINKYLSYWLIIQERIFQSYYEMQDPVCFNVAEQYLNVAEHNLYKNKTKYENVENFAHALVLYLIALKVVDKEDNRIDGAIKRAERFFSQIQNEYKNQKQLFRSYSYLQEFEGEYFSEMGKLEEAERAMKARLDVCEFLSGRETLDHNASRDFIKANEDLGRFYLSCRNYIKAHDFFTDVLHYICRWDDSAEKQKRTDEAFLGLCQAMKDIDKEKANGKIKDANIRLEGYGYYYFSCKEYRKACDCFAKAIKSITDWKDSEEKQLRLAETYLALCQAMVYIDKKEAQKQIADSKRIIDAFSLEIKQYFINQLDGISTD